MYYEEKFVAKQRALLSLVVGNIMDAILNYGGGMYKEAFTT